MTAIRASLSSQRDRLERVEIDVVPDDERPDEACVAVEEPAAGATTWSRS